MSNEDHPPTSPLPTWQPPATTRRWFRHHPILTAVAAVVVVGGLISALTQIPPSKPRTPPGLTVTVPVTQSSIHAPTSSAYAAMVHWFRNGGTAVNDIDSAVQQIAVAATNARATGDYSALGSACTQLSIAVAGLQRYGPMPYRPAQKWLAMALDHWSVGAADCQSASKSHSTTMIEAAATQLHIAFADFERAVVVTNKLSL